MKSKQTDGNKTNTSIGAFGNACLASCQKILAQIKNAKAAIFAESIKALKAQEQLLQLALNEAEALAWETLYPQLVFPTLAMEKVQAVATWDAHQQSVRSDNRAAVLAR